jgi:hypothetical protein
MGAKQEAIMDTVPGATKELQLSDVVSMADLVRDVSKECCRRMEVVASVWFGGAAKVQGKCDTTAATPPTSLIGRIHEALNAARTDLARMGETLDFLQRRTGEPEK